MRLAKIDGSQLVGICLGILAVTPVYADTDINSGFQEAMSYVETQGIASSAVTAVSNADDTLSGLSQDVSGEDYYDNPDAMAVDAESTVSNSGSTGSYIEEIAVSHTEAVDDYSADVEDAKSYSDSIKDETASILADSIYCADGSCVETDSSENTGYASSITELSALNSEASEFDEHTTRWADNPVLFSGSVAHCREEMVGALNCCKDSGWASGLFSCNTEEYELGHAKEDGYRVVYVGKYCSHKELFVCTEHKRTYCIFPSRLAYDLQVYGAQNQLGKTFGSAESPSCYGLSVSQIERIDLTKIDFSNIEGDVTDSVEFPDDSETLANLKNAITSGAVGAGSYD